MLSVSNILAFHTGLQLHSQREPQGYRRSNGVAATASGNVRVRSIHADPVERLRTAPKHLVSRDDRLAVARELLNPNVSRSGLDRCLRRRGVANLRDLQARVARPKHGAFKAYEPEYLHIDTNDLPQMVDESRRRYLFVAIDRATRWVFVCIYPAKTAGNAAVPALPAPGRTDEDDPVLTDKFKEFTDRLFGLRRRPATGAHAFNRLCADLGIEHRLAPPMRPQTNGMVSG